MFASKSLFLPLLVTLPVALADITITPYSHVGDYDCNQAPEPAQTYTQGVCHNFTYDVYGWTATPAAGNKQTEFFTLPDCKGRGATWHFAPDCLNSRFVTGDGEELAFASFRTFE